MISKLNCFGHCLWASYALLICSLPGFSQQNIAPNGSFEEGETHPISWELSGGTGEWSNESHAGSRSISVSGNGEEGSSNYWLCRNVDFEPNQTYRISFFTFEYFCLLRELIQKAKAQGKESQEIADAEKLLQIPESITESMTEFSTNPKPLYEHREKIAETIEKMKKKVSNE